MSGREQERSRIEAFLRHFVDRASSEDKDNHSALYISGSPGTGKTALVNTVLKALEEDFLAQNVQVLVVNCMALDGVDAMWQQLADMVVSGSKPKGRGKKGKDVPQQVVEKSFRSSERKW